MELKKYKLGDIAEILISSIDKKSKDGEHSVRLCNFVDVYRNWAITSNLSQSFMAATASVNNIKRFSLKKGYVAFTKDSETRDDIGIPAYIADDLDNTVLGYHCALAKPNADILSGKYLNAFLHSDYIKKYFELNATGSGMRYTLSTETLNNIPILAPSLEMQEFIGSIFSDIDRKICLNRQINDNLEAMAKQLYDYWFVQFDFPNEEGKPYKSSGGAMVWNEKLKREIPQGWSVLSVNDIAASVRGVSYAKDDMVDSNNGVLVLRGNNIQDNHLIYDSNVAYIPSSFVSENQRIRPLDIIMTMSSGSKEHIGKSAMFQFASEDAFGAFLTKFTAKEHCAYLLFNLFNSKYFKAKIKSIACGTGINNLTNQTFDEIYVVMPEDELLLEFDKRQSQIFAEIGLIEKSNIELTRQQDELLPLLMNGQASVNYHLSTQNCFKESTNSASISPIFSQNSA